MSYYSVSNYGVSGHESSNFEPFFFSVGKRFICNLTPLQFNAFTRIEWDWSIWSQNRLRFNETSHQCQNLSFLLLRRSRSQYRFGGNQIYTVIKNHPRGSIISSSRLQGLVTLNSSPPDTAFARTLSQSNNTCAGTTLNKRLFYFPCRFQTVSRGQLFIKRFVRITTTHNAISRCRRAIAERPTDFFGVITLTATTSARGSG